MTELKLNLDVLNISAAAREKLTGRTIAGFSREAMPGKSNARFCRVRNLDRKASLWVNGSGGEARAGAPGCEEIAPGQFIEFPANGAVSVYADVELAFSAARF